MVWLTERIEECMYDEFLRLKDMGKLEGLEGSNVHGGEPL